MDVWGGREGDNMDAKSQKIQKLKFSKNAKFLKKPKFSFFQTWSFVVLFMLLGCLRIQLSTQRMLFGDFGDIQRPTTWMQNHKNIIKFRENAKIWFFFV